MSVITITLADLHDQLALQEVSSPEHYAFVCPICSTVQSMASLVAAGADPKEVQKVIGYSCEGRLTHVGPLPRKTDLSDIAKARRGLRGCDWTLGGLLRLHELEIEHEDGDKQPCFRIATAEQAQALEEQLAIGAAA